MGALGMESKEHYSPNVKPFAKWEQVGEEWRNFISFPVPINLEEPGCQELPNSIVLWGELPPYISAAPSNVRS